MKVSDAVVAELQALAIAWKVWVGTDADLIGLIHPALHSIDPLDLRRQLHHPTLERELQLRDVVYWRGADSKFRLIDGQPPSDREEARRFLEASKQVHQFPGRVCKFCQLADDMIELREVGRRFVHPRCSLFLARWLRCANGVKARGPLAWQVLGLPSPQATRKQIEAAFKRQAQVRHPDKGGSNAAMAELNAARAEALTTVMAQTS